MQIVLGLTTNYSFNANISPGYTPESLGIYCGLNFIAYNNKRHKTPQISNKPGTFIGLCFLHEYHTILIVLNGTIYSQHNLQKKLIFYDESKIFPVFSSDAPCKIEFNLGLKKFITNCKELESGLNNNYYFKQF